MGRPINKNIRLMKTSFTSTMMVKYKLYFIDSREPRGKAQIKVYSKSYLIKIHVLIKRYLYRQSCNLKSIAD